MSYIIFVIYGIISIFLQIFFLREFIPLFHGSEFVIGIVLGHWLLSASLSNYVFTYVTKLKDNLKNITIVFFLLILFVFLSFIFIRSINVITPIDITTGTSLKTLFFYSFLSIFPVSFLLNLILNLLKQTFETILYQKKIKRYVCESIGFVVGGILFSFFMSSILTSTLLLIIVMLLLVNLSIISESRELKIFFVLLITFLIYVSIKYSFQIEKIVISNNYTKNNIIDISYFKNVQNILTEKNGEYYLYKNGICRYSLPSQDIFEEEDFAHIPILHHRDPKKLLLIGGIKYLSSIIKYDLNEITFVEDDESIIQITKNYIDKINKIFDDNRISICSDDARQFLQNTENKYDVVLIGLDIPINTTVNKFYTYEFFKIVSEKLTEEGFVALQIPGNMVYSPSLMFKLNASIYKSLKAVFPYVQIIPGKSNIVVASKSKMPFRLHIKKRLKQVEDETFVLSKYYVDERMDTQNTKWLNFQIRKYTGNKIANTDKNQRAVVFSIMYWQSRFSPFLMKFLEILINYSYFIVFIAVLLFFLVKYKYKVTSFVSGASAMWLQFVCFWGFQIYIGQVYQWFGLIVGMYMLGLVIASLYFQFSNKNVALNRTFFESEFLYLLVIISFMILIKYSMLNIYSLLMLSMFTGFVSGLEFAQLIKIYGIMKEGQNNIKLFFADSLGGSFACYIGGAFAIPIWGIGKSLIFILLLKFLIFTWWQYDKEHGL